MAEPSPRSGRLSWLPPAGAASWRPELPIPFRELAQARIAADQVIDGKVPDPTGGATHYYAISMKKAPGWVAKAKQTLKLGHHVFFKDVP